MNKHHISAIIVFLFCISLLFCTHNSPDARNISVEHPTEIIENNIITFVDPVIEAAVRDKLKHPTGDITKKQALTITSLRLQDYDNVKSLEDLKWLKNLETLFASSLGISDISVLGELKNLDTLYLSHNQISDISALATLENLIELNLESNQITDLTPIMHLAEQLYIPNFYNNPIPEENWNAFFYPIEENHVVTIICKNIDENMPEFTFKISSYLNPRYDAYEVYSIEISDGEEIFQNISVAEFALRNQTCIPVEEKEDLIFSLEDFNFDGYLDIRVFDRDNGNLGKEWLHFVWDPEIHQFEHDERLDDIPTPTFDQEKQLVYGERHGDFKHFYYTYQYIDDELMMIMNKERYYLFPTNEQIENYLSLSNVETATTNYLIALECVFEYDTSTKECSVTTDDYIIYSADEQGNSLDELVRIEVTSELGQFIDEDIYTTVY